MPPLFHLGREDTARRSKYPFADAASLTANTGAVLPRQAFIDAAVYPPGRAPFRLGRVLVTTTTATLEIFDARGTAVAFGSFTPSAPPDAIPLRTAHGDAAGVLITEPTVLSAVSGWTRGTHEFLDRAGEFVISLCHPAAGGVAGFVVDGEVVSGDVCFFGENGVVLRPDENAEVNGFAMRVDVVGEPLFYRADCEPIKQASGEEGLIAKAYVQQLVIQIGDDEISLTPNEVGHVSILVATLAPGLLPEGYLYAERPALRIPFSREGLRFELAGAPQEEQQ